MQDVWEDYELEAVANLCHEQWSNWMLHLFGKCASSSDGALIIPAKYVTNLRRLIQTPYHDLEEAEQDDDRDEARKFLEMILGGT